MEQKPIDVVTPPLKDKRLWMTVLVPLALFVGKAFGLELNDEFVSKTLDLVLAFVLGSQAASAVKAVAVAKIEGDKAKSAAVAPTVLDIANGGK